ncbi:MAG: hypothetical protein DSZ11_02775 [Sulfurovum sp.]|nr:MAG: hypothetical protein DSZ11_02775 [Sulfurovum sp.]
MKFLNNYSKEIKMRNKLLRITTLMFLMVVVPQQLMAVDTDGDGVIDALDLDNDNDGILDKVECPTKGITIENYRLWSRVNAMYLP